MSTELIQLLSSGGAGASVIVVTIIFLKYLKGERRQLMADRREERHEFLEKLEQISTTVAQLNTTLLQRPCLRENRRTQPETTGAGK